MLLVDLDEEWDEEEENDHPLSSDIMFDAWRHLEDSSLSLFRKRIVADVLSDLAKPTKSGRIRKDLQSNVEVIVTSIIANLLVTHRSRTPNARLFVSRRRDEKTPYDRAGFRQLPAVIDCMNAHGLLRVFPFIRNRRRTAVRAKGELETALASPDLKLSDVVRAPGEQRLVLTARPARRWINRERQPNTKERYEEDDTTRALRSEMEELNSFLSSHTITLEGVEQPSPSLHRQFTLRAKGDTPEWNLHGRVYGGFWMTLPEKERKHLRINGEPVADLDFTAMFPSLAYVAAGHSLPEGDPYLLDGLEDDRGAAKAALSALISVPNRLRQLPLRLREVLPQGWDIHRLRKAVIDRHPLLEPHLERDLGMKLMFLESRILLRALRGLMDLNVPALPMHDGMMVAASNAHKAFEAMAAASAAICGVTIGVTITQRYEDDPSLCNRTSAH
jgi:hypothetical protein